MRPVIELGSDAEGEPVLGEMRRMPWLLNHRRKLKARDIDDSLVRGSWRRLVYGQQATADGTVDRNAYVFCVLTQFHRHLKRRDVYAPKSSRWRDPRTQLIALRKLIRTMLPRVSLPEVILEVMSWLPGFVGAFTSVSGGRTRLEDLHVSIAACLSAHAMNIDFAEVVKRGVPALERSRLGHVNQNYLGAETYVLANPYLVEHQAGIPYAQALGGGMVAGIDGMRFVVPIPSIYDARTASTSVPTAASPG